MEKIPGEPAGKAVMCGFIEICHWVWDFKTYNTFGHVVGILKSRYGMLTKAKGVASCARLNLKLSIDKLCDKKRWQNPPGRLWQTAPQRKLLSVTRLSETQRNSRKKNTLSSALLPPSCTQLREKEMAPVGVQEPGLLTHMCEEKCEVHHTGCVSIALWQQEVLHPHIITVANT